MAAVAIELKDYRRAVAVEQGHLDTAAKIALEKVLIGLFDRLNKKQREVDFTGEFCGIRILISMEYLGLTPIISMAAYSEYVKDKHCKLFAYVNAVQPKQSWWFERMLYRDDLCKNVEATVHELTSANNINAGVLQPYWEQLMNFYNQGCLDLFE